MNRFLAHGHRFLLGLVVACAAGLRAEEIDVNAPLNPPQVEQLLGPIALYPDALVAIILPASTYPADIVLAQRYLSSGGDPERIDDQPWNESVRALARYPMLVKWLDENLTWTRQLGATFIYQPDEVMSAVQRLRVRAKANGTLTSTPQQKLVLDGDVIEIVPAQPDVIYVPYYDPSLVYGDFGGYGGPPYVTFGLGLRAGYWLSYDFNWRNRVIIIGDRHHNWVEHHDWDHRSGGRDRPYNGNWHPWAPPAGRPPYSRPDNRRPEPDIIRPRSLPGNPPFPTREQHPERPRLDNGSRGDDHNRTPLPSSNPGGSPDNRDRRPPPAPTPRPENSAPPGNVPRPSGPTGQPSPRPSGNGDWNPNNHDRPASPPPATPRPDNGSNAPRPTGQMNPPPPNRMPENRQPPSRPPESRPTVAPAAPRTDNPPPPPRDRSRDDKTEPQR